MRYNAKEKVIYLIRHGSIEMENSERRYIGQIDLPLSDEGVRQARLLQAELGGEDISSVFCSDLIRSVDTARIISASWDTELVIRRDLREINMGDWEGKTFREIATCHPEEYAKRGSNIISYRAPGAESFEECMSRGIAAFSDIADSTEGNILIVGHAGINRLLLCHILGMPLENLFRISQGYGCINILAVSGGQYCVKLLNGLVYAPRKEV
ncbi:histidine phosphatase family protein [Sporomusa malonica]|uniref:Probable phosphoglycerate mutase n=1 Tax=Sporomusa malonica TaxID=112901 RepID=A0A1W2EPN1_9FIRM|nr:histidine phosphatase family protein [Sporomusa malonica]SMD11650.1 probable phosphoglycerate mutase [Sporomusa malonica]